MRPVRSNGGARTRARTCPGTEKGSGGTSASELRFIPASEPPSAPALSKPCVGSTETRRDRRRPASARWRSGSLDRGELPVRPTAETSRGHHPASGLCVLEEPALPHPLLAPLRSQLGAVTGGALGHDPLPGLVPAAIADPPS